MRLVSVLPKQKQPIRVILAQTFCLVEIFLYNSFCWNFFANYIEIDKMTINLSSAFYFDLTWFLVYFSRTSFLIPYQNIVL